jgi:hypothetical protein
MSREIKFRTVRPRDNKIIYFDLENLPAFMSWPLMQYTSLKDARGEEIYEGDLIPILTKPLEVIFESGCFGVKIEDKFADLLGLTEVGLALEVIGNRYSNPELLK